MRSRPAALLRTGALLLGLAVAARAQAPDVVLIVADDVGIGDVGYLGSEIQTPHLDRLAAEGVVLDRFYTASQCTPSRAGLLTGRYGVRMRLNEALSRADTVGMPAAETTLAEALGDAGYETAMVGKWHLGGACHQHPTRHGFDTFLGLRYGGANYHTRQTPEGRDWWRGFELDERSGYTTDLIADEAVEVLTRPRDGPLFLYLPFTASHVPLQALDEDLALYPGLDGDRRTFAAMTTRLDRAVGRVMAAVRASGRPTLVWFLSDNGAVETFGGSNGGLAGGKGQTFEGGIRVPSVVWYPDWGPRTVEHPVWYLDVLPTVLGVVGAAMPELPLDGVDQGAQLAGAPPPEALLDRVLYTYRRTNLQGAAWIAAQTARWKYVRQPGLRDTLDALYRVDLDPTEQADSSAARPDVFAELRAAAHAFTDLTLPGAGNDLTLTDPSVPDLAACAGVLATPHGPEPDGLRLRVGPNPARGGATVRVGLDRTLEVRVDLVDLLGRRVRTLFVGTVEAGAERAVPIRPGGLPSGVYVVRATTASASATARVVLTR